MNDPALKEKKLFRSKLFFLLSDSGAYETN